MLLAARARAAPRASAGCARLGRRRAWLLALAAALITINWGTFIYGVNNGHVVETSLGYFINPLVTVALAGRRAGGAAAARAVGRGRDRRRSPSVVLTVAYGRPPWIALTLAFSFGFYGLVKKQVGVGGTQSLAVETAFLLAPALACVLCARAERQRDVPQRGRRATRCCWRAAAS